MDTGLSQWLERQDTGIECLFHSSANEAMLSPKDTSVLG